MPEAQEVVRHFLEVHDGDTLLPFTYREIYILWAGEPRRGTIGERERLGVAGDLDIHSFRHTFISWLANRTGTPLTEVQAAAGHASVRTTQIYVHRDQSMLRAGMGRLGADMGSTWYQQHDAGARTRQAPAGARS